MNHRELIEESNRQFIGAWSLMAEPVPGATIAERDGIAIADPGVPLFLLNAGFLTSPPVDAADGRRRAEALVEHFGVEGRAWIAPVSDDWSQGEGVAAFGAALREAGLEPAMQLTGMAAGALKAAARPMPGELEIRPVSTEEEMLAISDLNCAANQVPLEWGRESIVRPGYWTGRRFGYVGRVNGEAAAAGAIFLVDGIAYVGWMATAEAHRGKGYAEAIMRHGLEEEKRRSGVERTVLHATAMGEPVYRRLGYESHTVFTCWVKMPE
jgi:GNAT superfamily N-acetyltransferase